MKIKLGIECLVVMAVAGTTLPAAAGDDSQAPPLYRNLGSFFRQVSTRSPQAKEYVSQGFRFLYGFHYGEALRAFQQAAKLDPDCGMAWWGIATANGPHINDPTVSGEHNRAALDALRRAQQVSDPSEPPVEKALVQAELKRYADPPPADRHALDAAYADAMREVWKEFPKDPDVGALFAESLMDLRPWNQWTLDGTPQPGTQEVLATLDAVLALDPLHPLGNHLTIHALEASPHPEMALVAADRLRTLMPGLAHMVHMPSHIDVRLGHWHEAILANERAIAADRAFMKSNAVRGNYGMYMAHDYHMLTFAALMCGQRKRATEAIDEMLTRLPESWKAQYAPVADGLFSMPLEVRMRFGRWDDVLAAPQLPKMFPVARTLQHYARGVAYAAKKQLNEARAEQGLFADARKALPADASYSLGPASAVLDVAEHVLAGEILYQAGSRDEGIAELRKGVDAEDALSYDEPPDWIQPVRHALGAALMTSARHSDAERVYRDDLTRHPENGWSLYGLARSLDLQGKQEEAKTVRACFDRAWKNADFKLSTSCMCLPGI